MRRGVFLDRDGTINVDRGYTYSRDGLEFQPGAVEGLRLLREAGFTLVVITNQSGVARGLYSEADVHAFHDEMNRRLSCRDARIDRFYYCPHHLEAVVPRYRIRCACRKPGNALFLQAINDLDVDPLASYAIGDKVSDLIPAVELGATGVLLGDSEAGTSGGTRLVQVDGLLAAARHVLSQG